MPEMSPPAPPIGQYVRFWREKRQRTQVAIAGLIGITEEYLSQIERGLKTPSLQVLHALAKELGVPISALLGEAPSEYDSSDITVAPSVTHALMGYGPSASSEPLAPAALREGVESAWRMWQTSRTRFTEAASLLPGLIVETEHAVRIHRIGSDIATRRETLRVAADLYFMLRSYCRRAGRVDLSLMVADRALRAAEDADDPVRIAVAQWNLGHVLLGDGEYEGAEQVALLGIEHLRDELRSKHTAAMTGALELVAVVADARRKRWWKARDRLRDQAMLRAREVGEGNVGWTVFGPTNVQLHWLNIEMEAGEAAEALRVANQIDTSRLPSLERRFTFLLEVARCHDLRREDTAVLVHLLDLEEMAPEDLARSPAAHNMVARLRRRAHRTYQRQVNGLAERLNIL
ncbi:helix-turn-helix domain-containing protein [Acrocarpospora sp. B8E8]|uniref:helix-turn-helix domain-containing protein n=1 Tax=Acrocarpospora sp. B8E8 TaxID=3153572 RepID=UPI00325F34C6